MSVAILPKGYSTFGAELLELGAQSASLTYRLVKLAAAFDESAEWVSDGAITAAHWIAQRLDIKVCTAREWVRVGRALRFLPVLDEAFAVRQLSYSKVRTLTRYATSTNETDLCAIAQHTPAGSLGIALANWSSRNDDPSVIQERHQRERAVSWRTESDGMVVGWFCLPPLDGGRLAAAVDASVTRRKVTQRGGDASADASHAHNVTPIHATLAQQRADALVLLVTEGGARVETELIVHVRADGCSLDDGTPVADSVVERIAPDSFLRALIHDAKSRPINASGRRRHPTARQRLVVKERDYSCVDCGTSDFLEYDHDPPYEISGRTVVDELKLRCSRCHRRRHEGEVRQSA